MITCC